jgi:IS66 C-terminal element
MAEGELAMIALLVETCKLCGVDLQAYIADVLTPVVNGDLACDIEETAPLRLRRSPAAQRRGLRTSLTNVRMDRHWDGSAVILPVNPVELVPPKFFDITD